MKRSTARQGVADEAPFATADIQYLRVQHHICGVLSGTLPQVTQQNVFLGLPLVLMPEEVVLLVRNGRSRQSSILHMSLR